MGIELYGFAFFIFCLVCLALVVYSTLFSDIKRQRKLLDEKENKLLRLYQSIEEALDDFSDSVEKSHDELDQKIKEFERRLDTRDSLTASLTGRPAEKREAVRRTAPQSPRPSLVDMVADDEPSIAGLEPAVTVGRSVGADPAAGAKPEFKSLLDTVRQVEVTLPQGGSNRNDSILSLSQAGKTRAQIAKELGITLSEVDLVLGMHRKAK